MNAEELKQRLKEIFGNNIVFNREFDHLAQIIKNPENFLEWCVKVKNNEIRQIPAPRLKEGIIFIKKFGSFGRCIIIKIVNGEVKEVHLGDHQYYDKLRKILG